VTEKESSENVDHVVVGVSVIAPEKCHLAFFPSPGVDITIKFNLKVRVECTELE